jgi:ATP-dependent Clp protease ATP-binding subunit ClpA
MYPFERFTERAKKVLTFAQEEAERARHNYIGTEHLLLGLLRESDGMAAKALANLGVELPMVRQTIESLLAQNDRLIIQQIVPTSRVKKVIEKSFEEARRLGHNYVGTEHMLLGLLIEGEGIAAHVLIDLGATLDKVRAEVERIGNDPAHGMTVAPPPTGRGLAAEAIQLLHLTDELAHAERATEIGIDHIRRVLGSKEAAELLELSRRARRLEAEKQQAIGSQDFEAAVRLRDEQERLNAELTTTHKRWQKSISRPPGKNA